METFLLFLVLIASFGFPAVRQDGFRSVTLERTVCYGTCPAYKLTIALDGTVIFRGHDFIRLRSGSAKLTSQQMQDLSEAVARSDFFSLKNSYESEGCGEVWTDNPTEIVTVSDPGQSKTVTHYFGCRKVAGDALQRIETLAKTIDKITNSDQWVVGDKKGRPGQP